MPVNLFPNVNLQQPHRGYKTNETNESHNVAVSHLVDFYLNTSIRYEEKRVCPSNVSNPFLKPKRDPIFVASSLYVTAK